MTSPIPDEYQTATLVNGLPVATFRAQPYHRTITNIVFGNSVPSTLKVYRGQLGSVPVAQNDVGINNSVGGTIRVPAGQPIFVVWSVAGSPVSSAFARVSWTRTNNPLLDNAPATQLTWGVNPVTSLTIPNTAGPGQTRIVIGTDLPPPLNTYLFGGAVKASAAIIYYSATPSNDDYLFEASVQLPGFHEIIKGAVVNGVIVSIGAVPSPEAGLIIDFDGAGNLHILHRASEEGYYNTRSVWYDPNTNGAFAYMIPGLDLRAADPAAPGNPELWHILPLTAPNWTGTLAYKKNVSPAGTVSIASTNLNPNAGSKADGTTIATLPLFPTGYRPLTDMPVMMNAFGGVVSTAQPPHLTIRSSGNVDIFGIGTSTAIQVNQSYPTDF